MQPHKKIFCGARVRDVRSGREGIIEDIDEVSGLVEVVFDPVAEHFSEEAFQNGTLAVISTPPSLPFLPSPSSPPPPPSPPDKLTGAVLCCPVCGEVLPRTGPKSVLCPGCYREMSLEIKHDGRLVISMLCPDPEILAGRLIRGRGNETEKDGGAARG